MKRRLSRRDRKAQIIGQVFVLILGAIILITVLGYGYTSINKLLKRQQEIAVAAFEGDLNDAVQRVKLRFGSVERLDLPIPGKFSEVCIVNAEKGISEGLREKREAIYRKWQDIGTNVFLVPDHEFRLEDIEVQAAHGKGPYCCFKTEGKLVLRLEGRGRTTQISQWVQDPTTQTILQPCMP